MRKRVLFLGAFQEPGGEEEVITYLYKNLDRERYEPYLCGPFRQDFFDKHHIPREEILELPMTGMGDLKSWRMLIGYIDKLNIDLVHSHGNRGGLFGRLASRLSQRRPKSVWTVHLLIAENTFTISPMQKKVYTAVEYGLGRRFTDHIVAVSDDLRGKYAPHCPKTAISTIHNGIDVRRFHTDKAERPVNRESIKFGFVARMSKQKGLPYLIEAWKSVTEELRGTGLKPELILAGTGEEEAPTKELVKRFGLDSSVQFLGFRTDIPELLAGMDVLLLPSLFEGLPMVILESLASGTPVIATRVNGVPEVLEDGTNGRLVAPGNAAELAAAMMDYLRQPQLIRAHGTAGQKKVAEGFTKEQMLQKHMSLYDKLLAGAPAALTDGVGGMAGAGRAGSGATPASEASASAMKAAGGSSAERAALTAKAAPAVQTAAKRQASALPAGKGGVR
ncbi:glycosyltransferase family 4 protein [Gorillibacterium timonense]|uniref:glycosyltransferase family 4 protein n=1 Tax=Gorillibacterium timonense TaxID=1689269 RepID=UPI00071E6546|nr:glycosyltransferase family 4 protein [Gorillibacterium timonense]